MPNVRIDPQLYAQLRAKARAERRHVTAYIHGVLEDHCSREVLSLGHGQTGVWVYNYPAPSSSWYWRKEWLGGHTYSVVNHTKS